jgi:tetratricopeptide (TPR) repeat protein
MLIAEATGCQTALGDPEAARRWDACVAAFLSHGAATPGHLAATLEAEPEFGLGHAAMGFFQVLLGRRETVDAARASLARARGSSADGRAARYIDALALATQGRLRAAADALDANLAQEPGDSLAMKLSHALRFLIGDGEGMVRSLEAATGFEDGHPHAGYFAGCRAFAFEEAGAYAEAEAEGRRALALAPDDAWGLHAVAHVFEMTGRPDEGARWLEVRQGRWGHCNNFGYHVWWHLALFEIDLGRTERALALYDGRVRADRTDDYRDIANAASLLARLEVEGVAVGDRWEELAALAERRSLDRVNVFADLHYLLALLRGGRASQAARLAAELAEDAGGQGDRAEAARPGADVAEGLIALQRGEHLQAHARLSAAAGTLRRIGGSHAQRDVFARLTVEAAMRGGLWREAAAALGDRPGARPTIDPYVRRRLNTIMSRATQGARQPPLQPPQAHS